jgi:hypothetical protein
MRIFRGVAFGVMFAMNGNPFFRHHASGQPQPQPEEVAYQRMQSEGAVRLAAVQKYRNRDNGNMRQHQRD